MKRNCFLQLISFCATILLSWNCLAAALDEGVAKKWAEEKGEQLLLTFRNPDMNERYKTLDGLFLQYVDMDYISRFVIGRYWRTMSNAQKKQFQQVFNRYALAMYKTLPLEFANNLSYQVTNVTKEKDFTEITAQVNFSLSSDKAAQSVNVRFRLHQVDGAIKLVDIKLEESSLILAYRTRFAEMIERNDGEIEWFIEDLEDLAKAAEKTILTKIRG